MEGMEAKARPIPLGEKICVLVEVYKGKKIHQFQHQHQHPNAIALKDIQLASTT